MSGKRNVSVCRGHELANALYFKQRWRAYVAGNVQKNRNKGKHAYADKMYTKDDTL